MNARNFQLDVKHVDLYRKVQTPSSMNAAAMYKILRKKSEEMKRIRLESKKENVKSIISGIIWRLRRDRAKKS